MNWKPGQVATRPFASYRLVAPLSKSKRRQYAIGLILFAAIYLALTGKEFAASALAGRAELPKLESAVRLSPGNADYHHRLGRYLAFVVGDPRDAIGSYQSAVALNPYDAHYWLDLAGAYQVSGDAAGQRAALGRALEAEPTAPDVAWEAANFFLVDGDSEHALRELAVVIANDNSMIDPALKACWRIRPDASALLRDVVPAQTDPLLAFLDLLVSKQETAGAIETFDRLTRLHEKFGISHLFDFVGYLISVHRPDVAMAAWKEASATLGLSGYLPSEDNLVINGDFGLDVLNGGFDWTYVTRGGVRPVLDSSDFREGQRSLSISFDGPGISDAGIQQLIPVRAETAYDFSAYYKSADFEGAGGPEIVLRDAYTGAPLYTSDPLTDADFWKEVEANITTPKSTVLLKLTIERSPAGSPIRGKLLLDNFQLSQRNSSDLNEDHSKDKS